MRFLILLACTGKMLTLKSAEDDSIIVKSRAFKYSFVLITRNTILSPVNIKITKIQMIFNNILRAGVVQVTKSMQ